MAKIKDVDVAKAYQDEILLMPVPHKEKGLVGVRYDGSVVETSALIFPPHNFAIHAAKNAQGDQEYDPPRYSLTLLPCGYAIASGHTLLVLISILKGLVHAGITFDGVVEIGDINKLEYAEQRKHTLQIISLYTGRSAFAPAYYYDNFLSD